MNLMFSTYALGGFTGLRVLEHMAAINLVSDGSQFDYLSMNSTDGNEKRFAKMGIGCNGSMFNYTKFYNEKVQPGNFNSWEEVYEAIDIEPLKPYSDIYIVGTLLSSASGYTRTGKLVNTFPKTKNQLKFVSHGKPATNSLAILKANRELNTTIHEFAIDPIEFTYNLYNENYRPTGPYHLYTNYDIPRYGMQRTDNLQYFHSLGAPEDYEKEIDFTFGYTILKYSVRSPMIEEYDSLKNQFSNRMEFVRNDFLGIDTLVSKETYDNVLKLSRFTYILPAYDSTVFSIMRFLDALKYDCLPILNSMCFTDEVEKTYDVDLSPLKLNSPVKEPERLELLRHYQKKMLTVETIWNRKIA